MSTPTLMVGSGEKDSKIEKKKNMNAPTLLVGLGGTGSKIVKKVYELATEKQREKIGFVIFDTDVNELRTIAEENPQIHVVQTSTRLSVGEYLDFDRYSRDTWFPVNRILNGKALTEGAGQVRAVSRLALNTTIQQGRMLPLDEAIEDLYKLSGEKTVQAPRVILAGSLCGGTGSGLILPVAMYIRNFLTTRLQQGSAIIRGFFLLPEVFDAVIPTQSERNNLRSNAYAAIREIDAFMMKDDGSLPEQYDLHFMAPRPGSKKQDEYTGRPMDFCFLFDAQNISGNKMNSFAEYMEHAANCIYGMAVAPTSKRSNSSEDNVIREIVYNGGRNRFAGAGTSMLIYPVQDVRRYLSLCWAKESITDEWLGVDKQFAEEQRTNRNKRKEGVPTADIDRGNHYIQVVNLGAASHNPFTGEIRNLCLQFDGYMEKGNNWTGYLDALEGYINDRISDRQGDLDDIVDEVLRKGSDAHDKEATSDTFIDWYQQVLGYKSATIKCTETLARDLEYGLFRENKDFTKTGEKYRLEYWLHRNLVKEEFIHPNAVRYFLYNTLNELKKRRNEVKKEMDGITEYWESFEKKTFDVPETEALETPEEYIEITRMDAEGIKRFFFRGKIAEAQQNLKDRFSGLFRKTNDYWNAYVSYEVFGAAINYIMELCDAFHGFYDVLDRSIPKLDREMSDLENKYETKPGQALRYVCADKDCLIGISSEVVSKNSSLDIPSSLCCQIFNRMKAYALSENKAEPEIYFMNTFRDTVMNYLDSQIMGEYGSIVDMDILTALQKEVHYKNPKKELTIRDEELYAEHVIESTERLAEPFIESPVGKEPRVIPACAYSKYLTDPDIADFPGRPEFVEKHLQDRGGVDDEGIERNMILFYQSVYDLRASDLSKFAPPKKEMTKENPDGEYYKAYYELIQLLHPETSKSKAITPHIDRWWHVITKLPDLDEESQAEQEREINAAFFWAMAGHFVQMQPMNDNKQIYSADRVMLELDDEDDDFDQLVVSNGTPCDHLYEVLDSFTIFPRLVTTVRNKVAQIIQNDLYRKTPLAESVFYKYLASFRIDEYPLASEDHPDAVRCIFDLPILMKHSVPADLYFEKNMIRLLTTMLTQIKEYHAHFVTEKDIPVVYGNFLYEQFGKFIADMKVDSKMIHNLYNDSLFIHICKTFAKELENLDMVTEAEKVENIWRKLRAEG